MALFWRRQWRLIADVLAKHDDGSLDHEELVGDFADMLAADSPTFNRVTFLRRALPMNKESRHVGDD